MADTSVSGFLKGLQATPATRAQLERAQQIATRAEDLGSAGGDTWTRGEQTELAGALRRVTLTGVSRASDTNRRFANLQQALKRPQENGARLQFNGAQIQRVRAGPAEVIPADQQRVLLKEAGYGSTDGPQPLAMRGNTPLSAEATREILTRRQRDRDIPIDVTVDGRNQRPTTPMSWNDPRLDRSARATTVPGGADDNSYQLLANASIDGVPHAQVRAQPLYAQVRDAVLAARPELRDRINSPADLQKYVNSVTAYAYDGYHQVLENDHLTAALERGAILRTNRPMDGTRYPGDGRHEISPVIALRGPPGRGSQDFSNVWSIQRLHVDVRGSD